VKEFDPALKFFTLDIILIVVIVLLYHMCY
jgi:hypothetical protein